MLRSAGSGRDWYGDPDNRGGVEAHEVRSPGRRAGGRLPLLDATRRRLVVAGLDGRLRQPRFAPYVRDRRLR